MLLLRLHSALLIQLHVTGALNTRDDDDDDDYDVDDAGDSSSLL